MNVLLDTNILARLTQPTSPHHHIARTAVNILQRRGEVLSIVPQILYEFWAVATRPVGLPQNGLRLSVAEAHAEITRALKLFTFHADVPNVYSQWERLVIAHQVIGKTSQDARLVAAMLAHGIEAILTFNVQDFRRYTVIQVLDASKLAAGPP